MPRASARRQGSCGSALLASSPFISIGVLQAKAVVDGVRLSQADKARSRALIVDMNGLVLGSSDGAGVLSERVTLGRSGEISGYHQRPNGEVVSLSTARPAYETYRGQGWFGVILQKPA